jgi:hypothetical protein
VVGGRLAEQVRLDTPRANGDVERGADVIS